MELQRAALEVLLAHARREAPNECCGLLIGSEHSIEEAVPARNVHEHPARYQIDPADHFATIRRVRREGRTIIGAYHSHPNTSAVPSETDISEAYDPTLLYLIISLRDSGKADIRGYRIAEGNFHEVPLVTSPCT
jgi:[CysO sulfur-carrier protein]-S-L-cysteine hydrolase